MVEKIIATVLSLGMIGTPMQATVTSYAPFDNQSGMCADENPSKTSIRLKPAYNIVAVDPKRIPYGTVLYIPGRGFVMAGDTGGAARRYDGILVDVFSQSYKEAITWGRKELTIRVFFVR